ncbi:MAG: Rrf2 family transcriptional regulator [Candidatus Omnitrophica bacterium]|nr:Rrf2 family transcriptional regulator [Candidatus Omnitrophota bacterium]MDD5236306.1 Rrf2 family transcriptional regulator [Candidatus Omnitrophota bacterium]MDD5610309.1 Rrf2 family transcriptional regulator [Candidatus Omnitrophota bacterium]
MRITYKGDYAINTILDLAVHYNKSLVTIHELARRSDMPIKFLEQVLLELKRGGFVKSKRGKVGGYFLAKHPAQIKLGDVIRFIDGPIEPIACVEKRYSGCNIIERCVLRKIWQEINLATSNVVDNVTFEDLLNQINVQKETAVYQI